MATDLRNDGACALVKCQGRSTRLVVIRGNSGCGKSTISRYLQRRHGRGAAHVEQDHLRRVLLRERDGPGGVACGLIEATVRYVMDHGYHVILDGILHASKYSAMVHELRRAYPGRASLFYLDVSRDETYRRHATRPESREFTVENMAGWYLERDTLGDSDEHIIAEGSSLEDSVRIIATLSGLPMHDPTALPPIWSALRPIREN